MSKKCVEFLLCPEKKKKNFGSVFSSVCGDDDDLLLWIVNTKHKNDKGHGHSCRKRKWWLFSAGLSPLEMLLCVVTARQYVGIKKIHRQITNKFKLSSRRSSWLPPDRTAHLFFIHSSLLLEKWRAFHSYGAQLTFISQYLSLLFCSTTEKTTRTKNWRSFARFFYENPFNNGPAWMCLCLCMW